MTESKRKAGRPPASPTGESAVTVSLTLAPSERDALDRLCRERRLSRGRLVAELLAEQA